MPFSNGTLIEDAGRVEFLTVVNTYVPIAGDVHINGTLHDSIGNMYLTFDALVGASDVFINGIIHTANGVRYAQDGVGAQDWPEGFATTADGRQATRTVAVNTAHIRGIGRHVVSSRMNIIAGTPAPNGDALDNEWVIDSPPGGTWTYLDFNRNSAQPIFGGSFVYMTLGTFNFEQFGAGGINLVESTDPAVANLDNNRYRCRRLSGDEISSSTFFATNLAIGDWSVWRGGNPGAPQQRDSIFYNLAAPGSLSGSWQVQVEEPDGSDIIVVDRTIALGITRT